MIKKQVWRYWCEFCGKGSCSGGHISSHEKACTANPGRVCRMHAHCESPQRPIVELVASLDLKRPNCNIDALREIADGCPACMLAAIRQSGIFKWDGDPESQPPSNDWNFKTELKNFWDTINYAKEQRGYY